MSEQSLSPYGGRQSRICLKQFEVIAFGLLIGWSFAWTSTSQAVVEEIDATVTAEVEEYLDNVLVNSDSVFEELNESTGNLPLVASAGFARESLEEVTGEANSPSSKGAPTVNAQQSSGGEQIAAGAVTTTFSDPRTSGSADPDAFGISAVVVSDEPAVTYTALSAATETRRIIFTAEEIGSADGSELNAGSEFFIDGLLIVFGDFTSGSSGETMAEVTLSVEQMQGSAGESESSGESRLNAGITLTASPDGTASFSTSGAIEPGNVAFIDGSDFVEQVDSLFAVSIPNSAIPYEYPAVVGEGFVLKAAIEAYAQNGPDTGAVVLMGVPIEDVVSVIEEVTGEEVSQEFQAGLEFLLGDPNNAPLKPLTPTGKGTEIEVVRRPLLGFLLPGCGAMGAECLMAVGLLPLALLAGRRLR
jgi:hypothetical protein